MAEVKKLLLNHPKVGDRGIYNFVDGYAENPPVYEDSTSLPKNNDKFQNKDLYTVGVDDPTNKAIIERNLKFEGDPFLTIKSLYIQNTGVDGTVKNCHVAGWIFSEEAYGGDPTKDGYGTIKTKMANHPEWKFYSQGFSNRSQGNDIGNITAVEGVPIVSNFATESPRLGIGDITGRSDEFFVDEDLGDARIPSGLKAFKLSATTEDTRNTSIFNESQYNPIYICIFTQGDKKVAWPIETDGRKKKYSIFKINNEDLFQRQGGNYSGLVYQTDFKSPTRTRTGEGGSSNSAQQSAWRVSSLLVSINTAAGVKNNFNDSAAYRGFIDSTLPSIRVNENIFNSIDWLGALNPKNQLDNLQLQGGDLSADGQVGPEYRHPDFVPFTTFGFIGNNDLSPSYVDLQSYHYDFNSVMKSSYPLNVTFKLDIKDVVAEDLPHYMTNYYPDHDDEIGDNGNQLFFYFVIDWDDKDDKYKTIEDFEEDKPVNSIRYLEKQNQNLYKVKKLDYTNGTNDGVLSNVYTTPGIKNIKFIIISAFEGTGDSGESPNFEIGRWKLCTSRIYLDIPPNQYPDFSVVGGSDYTTLPWPYTAPIIGGVNENSKYKISVQNTLAGGKIGELDIIDEKFLLNDLENDEMGKNVEAMDLEQCRYFNNNYNIHTLLGIYPFVDDGLFRPFNYQFISTNRIEDMLFTDGVINEPNDYKVINKWWGEAAQVEGANENRVGTDSYTPITYDNEIPNRGISISYNAEDVTGNCYTYFRYLRQDLHEELNLFEFGGTEYTLTTEIKFNQWNEYSPSRYQIRLCNRDADHGTPYHNSDGFELKRLDLHRGEDGVYSDSGLVNKLGNYGEWINVQLNRKLISDYTSSLDDSVVKGFPAMEFVSSNWYDNWPSWADLRYDYNNFESTPEAMMDSDGPNDIRVRIVWEGLDNYSIHNGSIPFPWTYIVEINEDGSRNYDNVAYRSGWDWWLYSSNHELGNHLANPPGDTIWIGGGDPPYEDELYLQGFKYGKTYDLQFSMGNLPAGTVEDGYNNAIEVFEDIGIDDYWEVGHDMGAVEGIMNFEIRAPILVETELYNSTPYEELLTTYEFRRYWNGSTLNQTFSEESSVGQIFISDNQDNSLKQNCKLELNTGDLVGKTIVDSSGNSNKGLLIGDYKVKKNRKGQPMKRDSFIKVPKKTGNSKGAL